MIIGVVGFIGSGKSTFTDHLIRRHNYSTDAFAKPLKDVVSSVFGWRRHDLEGDTIESRNWRNQVDDWWSTQLGIDDLSPRKMLQHVGTDLFRNHFHDSIWIKSLEKRLKHSKSENIVISDCRFPNEYNCIKDLGGIMVRITRGSEPDWYDDAVSHNILGTPVTERLKDIHPSEYSLLGFDFEHVFTNDSTIQDFYYQIEKSLFI